MQTYMLPTGYTDASGSLHREVELCSITGKIEESLARVTGNENALPVTFLLEHCLKRMGTLEPVRKDYINELTETDRIYLLWEIQRMTFGDRIQGTVSCPNTECGKQVDIDFYISDMIRGISTAGETFEPVLNIEILCPECESDFRFPFGIQGFFLDRLRSGIDTLYHEVHTLAYHYHWNENDILSMPREKRKMYLEILAAEFERMKENDASFIPHAVTNRTINPFMPGTFQPGKISTFPPGSTNLSPDSVEPEQASPGEPSVESNSTGSPVTGSPTHETEVKGSHVFKMPLHEKPAYPDFVHEIQLHESKGNEPPITETQSQTPGRMEKPAPVDRFGSPVPVTRIDLPGRVAIERNDLQQVNTSAFQPVPGVRSLPMKNLPDQVSKKPGGVSTSQDNNELPVQQEQSLPKEEIKPTALTGGKLKPLQEKPVRRLGFVYPSSSTWLGSDESNEEAEPAPQQRTSKKKPPYRQQEVEPVYEYMVMPPVRRTPSAFLERMFLGHLHLKLIR